MSKNGISTQVAGNGSNPVATKILRRNAKLALAAGKRSTTNTPGYRTLNTISGSHTAYVGTSTATVSGTASPTVGRPWAT